MKSNETKMTWSLQSKIQKQQLCMINRLTITGTCFPQPEMYMTTLVSPDENTQNQIDNIPIVKEWKRLIRDTRVYLDDDASSNQYLRTITWKWNYIEILTRTKQRVELTFLITKRILKVKIHPRNKNWFQALEFKED